MTPKQERFIAEYLIDLNATQAAIRAGYSPKTARQQGDENLSKPDIAAAIADRKAKQLETANLTAARVLEEFRRLAFFNPAEFFDDQGNVKPIHQLPPEQAAAIAQFEVIVKNAQAGDGVTDRVHKIRFTDKSKSLESLAKHFGLLTERVDHSGEIIFKHELPD